MVSRFFGKSSKKSVPETKAPPPGGQELGNVSEDDGFTLLGPKVSSTVSLPDYQNPTSPGYPALPATDPSIPPLDSMAHPLDGVPFKLAEPYSLDGGLNRGLDQSINELQQAVDQANGLLTSLNTNFAYERSVLEQNEANNLSNDFGLLQT